MLWCGRNAYVPRAQRTLDLSLVPEPYHGLALTGEGPPRYVPQSSLPELEGSLFAEHFGWIVRAADGRGASAVFGRALAPGRRVLTGVAMIVAGSPRVPGLRVMATGGVEAMLPVPVPDADATPALLAGRYAVDALDPVPDELVVELLDPTLPPLMIESLDAGLLVATCGPRVPGEHLDALAAATARLRHLLLDDVATVLPWH